MPFCGNWQHSGREWQNRQAGEVVARAILDMDEEMHEKRPVFPGFRRGHYVARQTDLIFKSSVAFGHLFSNYQMSGVNLEAVEEARSRSNATYAYLDRKSLRSEERKRMEAILAGSNSKLFLLPFLSAEPNPMLPFLSTEIL